MTAADARRTPGGIHTLRRVIMLVLLGTLVSVTASGATGLLHLLLDTAPTLRGSTSQLARSIASIIIAAPLGAGVYWLTRRWLAAFDDRRSLLWPVYLAAFGTVALLIALGGLLSAAAAAVAGRWEPSSLALGIVWCGVWAWHAWMWHTPSHSPARLPAVGPALGVLVGVGFTLSGTVSLLSQLFRQALHGPVAALAGATPWWMPVLQQSVWAVGGALIWWWHWRRGGVQASHAPFAGFTLVVIAGFVAVATTLGGLASALSNAASLALDLGQRSSAVGAPPQLDDLATGVAAAAAGALLWALHRRPAAAAPAAVRWSSRLVACGVALVFMASGLGVVVNALLATTAVSIAGDARPLLLGGLSALLVGGIAWWLLWRPLGATTTTEIAGARWSTFAGRRVYLVAIFGASALTAVVTLLVIAYGVLQSVFGVPWAGNIVNSIRAPLGLLTATALVAVYHFAVWRRSPAAQGPEEPARPRIGIRVTVVAAGDAHALGHAVEAATGATVTVWTPRDQAETTDAAALVHALEGVEASHVLVVARAGRVEVVPLAD